jgi:histidinol dehydrogenase
MIRRLDATAADFDAALEALAVPMESGDSASVPRSPGSSPMSGSAARRRCWSTPRVSIVCRPRRSTSSRFRGSNSTCACWHCFQTAARCAGGRRPAHRGFSPAPAGAGLDLRGRRGQPAGQRVTPLSRVGVYVPGGKASYPSSVLMNAIPARVAGVGEIIMVAPTPDGERNPLVLAAAALAGVDRVYCIGGAQAVAALALGTAGLPGSTRSSVPAIASSPRPSARCSGAWAST